jgi:hypothetical protein
VSVTDVTLDDLAARPLRYSVAWPVMAVRETGALEETILRRGDLVPDGVPLATCELLATVGALVTTDDALPVVPTSPAATPALQPVDPPATGTVPALPTKSAPKAAWTAWAIDHGGIPASVAAAMTKDDLIAALSPATDPATDSTTDSATESVADAADGLGADPDATGPADVDESDEVPSLPVNPDAGDEDLTAAPGADSVTDGL